MNTKNLKAYAPKARTQFIEAVKKRAAHFGIYEDRIEQVRIEGGAAIIEGRAFTRKEGEQRKRLETKVAERGYDMFIREMAYTWFNRLAALRYMEIHDYFDHGFRVLSHPTNPDSLPEILSHASDVAGSLGLDKSHIIELQLAGDKEEELYRELLLGQCHHLSKIMPFMFEAIDDATELLLPNNLTKTDSILKGLINDIPEEDWQEIEVIGWLYQFYISEHKDAVIGKVVKSEDIPAATQLFTPNWIVKYLVQNSVGRQWLATYPDSDLKGKMEYYIEPAEQSDDVIDQLKAITPTSIDPEEIKVLDPACGSGHILLEVYEVLREIYLERGYRLREIPELILTKNIYGLDIDDRAAQLAAFALMMKARVDDRRIFQRVEGGEVSLNIFSLQSTENLDIPKLWKALDLEGTQQTGATGGLFEDPKELVQPTGIFKDYFELLNTLKLAFLQAKTLGSLIEIDRKHLDSLVILKEQLNKKIKGSDPAAKQAALVVLSIITQATCLAQRYDAVIANPPYMGSKGMNSDLKSFAKKQFPNSKADLFAIFMERSFSLLNKNGFNAQVNMQSWMFLSSYENLRNWIIENKTFETMAHLGSRAFSQISGEVVQTAAWVLRNSLTNSYVPTFFRLIHGGEEDKRRALLKLEQRFDNAKQEDFKKIPGSPIAYWVSDNVRKAFEFQPFGEVGNLREGIHTGFNDGYIRHWAEVDFSTIKFESKSQEGFDDSKCMYVPYNKGGAYRKWYGNNEYVLMWREDKRTEMSNKKGHVRPSQHLYFLPTIEWSLISSGKFGARVSKQGVLNDVASHYLQSDSELINYTAMGIFNSKLGHFFLSLLNPTLNFSSGVVARVPYLPEVEPDIINAVKRLIEVAKYDWDLQEISQEFKVSLKAGQTGSLENFTNEFGEQQRHLILEALKLENQVNEYLVSKFKLVGELESRIILQDITLTYNPYQSQPDLSEQDYQLKIRTLTIGQLISLAIGIMMGRYSLDRESLVYAHSGNEGFKELEAQGAYRTFPADDDGIIPLASEEWLFDDDATTRFKEFVKTVWGDKHLLENLKFVAESLCLHALKPKKGESAMDTIRRYFSTQFFKDHCKTYKKRPIYWLFSSGKEKAFECLVYLHRYNEGTLSRMRTEYVTPLMGKYDAQHNLLTEQQLQATGTEARRIEKDLKSLEKKQAELRTFDEQLKHYAEMRITLDLDDGVKANYGKFGNLLADVKAIHGKNPEGVK